MASFGERQIWTSSWFAAVKTGGLLDVSAVGIVHPNCSIPSTAHGKADAQLLERAGQGNKSCLQWILSNL